MADFGGAANKTRRRLGDRGAIVAPAQSVVSSITVDPAVAAARKFTRTPELMESVHRVDTAPSEVARAEIVQWIEQVYAARGVGVLVGMFSHCYLGAPFVDHSLSLVGTIVEHHKPTDPVPVMYQAARGLAVSEQYAYIEIYADGSVIPIRHDGSPAL